MDNTNRVSFKPTWQFHSYIKSQFHDDAQGGPVARISELPQRFPKFSMQLGWMQGSTFVPFFRPGVDLRNLQEVVSAAQVQVETLAIASQEAETAARAEWEAQQKAMQEKREAKQREVEAKKAAKKQRHENNLARRREEDRQRTQQAKSGGRK